MSSRTTGYLAFVLHAHLPFVRHPEHARPMEERWLFEALAECYLPLLAAFDRLRRAGISFALTISITPPLCAMLRDELLCARFDAYLAQIQKLAAREVIRLAGDGQFQPIAQFYVEQLIEVRQTWERIGRDVVSALVGHADAGEIDLMSSAASHAYLPGLLATPSALRAQLQLGMRSFQDATSRTPMGLWLPECGFAPEFDRDIAEAGFRFTIVDAHGIAFARPRPTFGGSAPVASPSGTVFFARDPESSKQVWSRLEGYPGDAYYREFYRDVGFELPLDYLGEQVGPYGTRTMTGLKYYRITGKAEDKAPYQPGVALERARVHAEDFVEGRVQQVTRMAAGLPTVPIVVAPYDAELFGHWWFEGPTFIEHVFRALHRRRRAGDTAVQAITLRHYLELHPVMVRATPAASSWGAGGYGDVWIGPESSKVWRHVHHASRYISWLVEHFGSLAGQQGRALDQAIRELLLLQSSDWGFIMTTGTVAPYAWARVRVHVHRLRHLAFLAQKSALQPEDVAFIEDVRRRDNFLGATSSDALRSAYARGSAGSAGPRSRG